MTAYFSYSNIVQIGNVLHCEKRLDGYCLLFYSRFAQQLMNISVCALNFSSCFFREQSLYFLEKIIEQMKYAVSHIIFVVTIHNLSALFPCKCIFHSCIIPHLVETAYKRYVFIILKPVFNDIKLKRLKITENEKILLSI